MNDGDYSLNPADSVARAEKITRVNSQAKTLELFFLLLKRMMERGTGGCGRLAIIIELIINSLNLLSTFNEFSVFWRGSSLTINILKKRETIAARIVTVSHSVVIRQSAGEKRWVRELQEC